MPRETAVQTAIGLPGNLRLLPPRVDPASADAMPGDVMLDAIERRIGRLLGLLPSQEAHCDGTGQAATTELVTDESGVMTALRRRNSKVPSTRRQGAGSQGRYMLSASGSARTKTTG